MEKKPVLIIVVAVLLMSLLCVTFRVEMVEASGTIYIRADGSIDPPTANITTIDNVTYTFTGNITDGIVAERNDTIIEGDEYTLQGSGNGVGLNLTNVHNITIRNINIKNFSHGIRLETSSKINIQGNNITNNFEGVYIYSSSNYNTVNGNNITANNGNGVFLYPSSNYNTVNGNNITNNGNGVLLAFSSNYNTVNGNNITNNRVGVYISFSSNNTVNGNNITNNGRGIWVVDSDYNEFYHNFIDNINQTYVFAGVNIWDKGYPTGGNYWSDYEDKYPNATEIDESGIWDTPYVIDEYNQDNYPIIPELPSLLILPLFMFVSLLAVLVYRRKRVHASLAVDCSSSRVLFPEKTICIYG